MSDNVSTSRSSVSCPVQYRFRKCLECDKADVAQAYDHPERSEEPTERIETRGINLTILISIQMCMFNSILVLFLSILSK